MKKFGFLCVVIFSLVAQNAMADFLGLANGRSANLDNMADLSVDGGVNIASDGTLFGARVNFKVSPDLMVFGDIGQLSLDDDGVDGDGLVYGIGAFYQLRNINLLENTDLAVKGAYHLGTIDFGSGFDGDLTEISLDALISGDQLGETDFGWYANVGLHIVDSESNGVTVFNPITGGATTVGSGSDSETELLFGGGITGPLSFGEFFAGVDFLDGALLVAGVRYNL